MSTDESSIPNEIPSEAFGEDLKARPQPADELPSALGSSDLIDMMRRTIDRLEADGTARGDLKILSRTLRELRYAFKVFQPYRRRRKVTVFGSARTPQSDPSYQHAVAFSKAISDHGWMVVTGAGHGIMEAGHRGAGKAMSMGLNIMLPFEQSANPIIDGDPKLVTLKYFFTRKLMFLKECSAVVCFPGGFGTLDEALEVLTLVQTGKQTMLPIVLLDRPGGTYWSKLGEFIHEELLQAKLISPEDVHLYKITDSVPQAIDELLSFYRNYHSMRYVDELLVLRLQKPISNAGIDRLNSDFADIVTHGKIEQTGALKDEANEPDLANLARLTLQFNRKALGRLRQLIDAVNQLS